MNKCLAIAVLVLAVGCSDNNAENSVSTSNPVQEETLQEETSSNPVAAETQTANSPQNQSVAKNNPRQTNNSQANSYQYQPVPETNHLKPVNDTFIIPGKRVGLITANTSRADLVELYGETNLKDDVVYGGEGTVSFPVTKVNSTTPGALTIAWTDESRNKISHVSGFGRQWKTLDSLRVGTSMSGLGDVLGEFELNGFAWDVGGLVHLEGTNLSKYQDKLALKLSPDENAFTKNQKSFNAVSGDSKFSSTNPNFKPLDVRISSMIITFDKSIVPEMY